MGNVWRPGAVRATAHRRSKDELLLLLLEIVGLRECRPPTSKSESDLNAMTYAPTKAPRAGFHQSVVRSPYLKRGEQ